MPPARTSTESISERLRTSEVDCVSEAIRFLDIILFLPFESIGEFVSLGPSKRKLIDSDIAGASTLPARFYRDPAVVDEEKRQIFHRTWQIAGHVSQFQKPGDYMTVDLLGEPLLIVRNTKRELKGFYNICKHRAGPPAEGCGSRKVFRCGYHGWTYSLDGALLNAPEMEGVEDFSKE